MTQLPTGVVSFLFTDIVGSSQRWELYPEAMKTALERHDTIIKDAIYTNRGIVFKTAGDAFYAVFTNPADVVNAALEAQLSLQAEDWSDTNGLRVRMALHSGRAVERNNDYFGPPMNRIARMLSHTHGEQIIISETLHHLVQDTLPSDTGFKELGKVVLRGLSRPEGLFQLTHPRLTDNFPPLKPTTTVPNNLPIKHIRLVGSKKRAAEVKRLLKATRLVTITGPGGCGKTTLALEVASQLLNDFNDGIWLIPLPLVDASYSEQVIQEIALALKVPEKPGVSFLEAVIEFLVNKRVILLLDNCDHFIQLCAQQINAILSRCPNVYVLATSREELHVPGEIALRVELLSLPPETDNLSLAEIKQSEAVQLFLMRAKEANPRFVITNQDVPYIASICRATEGIPYAIELAAPCIKWLSLHHLSQELNQLMFLLVHQHLAPPRQTTLEATIKWSYSLLTETEQTLLRNLSVFEGSWTLEALASICTDAQNRIDNVHLLQARLIDKSLVIYEPARDRYRLLDVTRQYLRRFLVQREEEAIWKIRHRAYYYARVMEIREKLKGPDLGFWLNILHDDLANIYAVLQQSLIDQDKERGEETLQIVTVMSTFWRRRGYFKAGYIWLTKALTIPTDTELRKRILLRAGQFCSLMELFEEAEIHYLECLRLCKSTLDKKGEADVLRHLSYQLKAKDDLINSRALTLEYLEIYKELQDEQGQALALGTLGELGRILHMRLVDGLSSDTGPSQTSAELRSQINEQLIIARQQCEQALEIFRRISDLSRVSWMLNVIAACYLEDNFPNFDNAIKYAEEAVSIDQKELRDRWSSTFGLQNLAYAKRGKFDLSGSNIHLKECLAIFQEYDRSPKGVNILLELACNGSDQKFYIRALKLLKSIETVEANIVNDDKYAKCYQNIKTALGLRFDSMWDAMHPMTLHPLIKYALSDNDESVN